MKRGNRACSRHCSAGCATAPAPVAPLLRRQVSRAGGMQYLYGSAEAAATSQQAYNALLDAVLVRLARDRAGTPATGDQFRRARGRRDARRAAILPCGDKPLAVVFDVDETILLNLGFEDDDAAHPDRPYDAARWQDWERTGADAVAPVPGALTRSRRSAAPA